MEHKVSETPTLKERLITAQLATVAFIASDGHMSIGVRTNDEAADVVIEILEEELQKVRDDIKKVLESESSLHFENEELTEYGLGAKHATKGFIRKIDRLFKTTELTS